MQNSGLSAEGFLLSNFSKFLINPLLLCSTKFALAGI